MGGFFIIKGVDDVAVYTLADEIARKKAVGEDRNYGKVPTVPAKATIQPAPVTQVQPTVAKTVVQPAPIAPITNAATNTVNPAPVTGYGQGGTYGKTPGLGAAYAANKALTSTDAGRNSEITRSQGVIAELQKALQADPNNADLQTRLAGANKYLTVNLGYKPGEVGASGAVVGADQGYGANEYQNEVDSQVSAFEGELDSAKIATQFGIDTNQNYLNESLDQLKGSEAVALDQAQQTQNRFGGLYSGGLGYQSGAINSSYANQRGGLARDVAGRNQQLLDQYGSQAKTISTQIQQLKSAAPGIIRDKIAAFKQQEAQLTGDYNGGRTLAGDAQDYAQSSDTRDYNRNVVESDRSYKLAQDEYKRGIYESDRTFKENVRQKGLDYALQQKAQSLQAQNMAQDNARGWASINLNRDELAYRKEQDALSNGANEKIDPKLSANNAYELRQELLTNKPDANTAYQYLQSQSGNLSPGDYQEILKWIQDGMKPPKSGSADLFSELFGGGA